MRSSPRCWPCTVPQDLEDAFAKAQQLIADGGYGHTSSIYLNATTRQDVVADFASRMKTCRILVNTPSSQGGIGDLYNFKLAPSLTLGCGSWGGNSVSENVGVKHLLNIKTVAERRENMLWFRAPQKVYLKKGCLPVALDELKHVMGKKRAFIVTDSFLYHNGYTKTITDKLDEMGVHAHHLLRRGARSHPGLRQGRRQGHEQLSSPTASSPWAAAPPWTRARSCG